MGFFSKQTDSTLNALEVVEHVFQRYFFKENHDFFIMFCLSLELVEILHHLK
jgi:hypothetical protein